MHRTVFSSNSSVSPISQPYETYINDHNDNLKYTKNIRWASDLRGNHFNDGLLSPSYIDESDSLSSSPIYIGDTPTSSRTFIYESPYINRNERKIISNSLSNRENLQENTPVIRQRAHRRCTSTGTPILISSSSRSRHHDHEGFLIPDLPSSNSRRKSYGKSMNTGCSRDSDYISNTKINNVDSDNYESLDNCKKDTVHITMPPRLGIPSQTPLNSRDLLRKSPLPIVIANAEDRSVYMGDKLAMRAKEIQNEKDLYEKKKNYRYISPNMKTSNNIPPRKEIDHTLYQMDHIYKTSPAAKYVDYIDDHDYVLYHGELLRNRYNLKPSIYSRSESYVPSFNQGNGRSRSLASYYGINYSVSTSTLPSPVATHRSNSIASIQNCHSLPRSSILTNIKRRRIGSYNVNPDDHLLQQHLQLLDKSLDNNHTHSDDDYELNRMFDSPEYKSKDIHRRISSMNNEDDYKQKKITPKFRDVTHSIDHYNRSGSYNGEIIESDIKLNDRRRKIEDLQDVDIENYSMRRIDRSDRRSSSLIRRRSKSVFDRKSHSKEKSTNKNRLSSIEDNLYSNEINMDLNFNQSIPNVYDVEGTCENSAVNIETFTILNEQENSQTIEISNKQFNNCASIEEFGDIPSENLSNSSLDDIPHPISKSTSRKKNRTKQIDINTGDIDVYDKLKGLNENSIDQDINDDILDNFIENDNIGNDNGIENDNTEDQSLALSNNHTNDTINPNNNKKKLNRSKIKKTKETSNKSKSGRQYSRRKHIDYHIPLNQVNPKIGEISLLERDDETSKENLNRRYPRRVRTAPLKWYLGERLEYQRDEKSELGYTIAAIHKVANPKMIPNERGSIYPNGNGRLSVASMATTTSSPLLRNNEIEGKKTSHSYSTDEFGDTEYEKQNNINDVASDLSLLEVIEDNIIDHNHKPKKKINKKDKENVMKSSNSLRNPSINHHNNTSKSQKTKKTTKINSNKENISEDSANAVTLYDQDIGKNYNMITVFNRKDLCWADVEYTIGKPYNVALSFISSQATCCEVCLPPQTEKGLDESQDNYILGHVHTAPDDKSLQIMISDNNLYNIGHGDWFLIPDHTHYNFNNTSTYSDIFISLYVIKDIE
ncbi:hypothetical protein cand_000680 [Cryptosporidium andersoni]|uniref:Uncharacterized protein n=1 Tax=Cryptosporidium andersoni TaxID=117008 RepID=A0A1J4MSZ0_9CRYT|nr:hypothetical protein cand_000680 [Cryptosporidium andersoni]